MIEFAATVSLVSQARGGPFLFQEGLVPACSQAAALGFQAVEIFPPSAEAIDRDELRRLLKQHRLRVAAFGSGAGWLVHRWHFCHPNPAVRDQARVFAGGMIDLAAEFGAPAIVGSMQGRIEEPVARQEALAWLGDAFRDLGARARRAGQVLLYEPLNRYETNVFNRLHEARAFLEEIGADNVRLLADSFHMNIEESDIAAALRAAGRRLGHMHLVDSNRRAAGMGHLDFIPIARVLNEIGYEGCVSAEALPLPDSPTAARQTVEKYCELFRPREPAAV